jgi:hypothetical protein
MALVRCYLEGGGDTDNCMPWNLSIGRYSDDVKVCIGFSLDSYSLVEGKETGVPLFAILSVKVGFIKNIKICS